jgi:hypothetical protein
VGWGPVKWVYAIVFYHPLMFVFILITFFLPFIALVDLRNIIENEVPSASMPFIMLSWIAFWFYLAMKSEFLGKLYRKITVLLPLLQMLLYTTIALNAGAAIMHKWVDHEPFSKAWAIFYAISAIAAIRLLMSLLYWKYPLVPDGNDRKRKREEGAGV